MWAIDIYFFIAVFLAIRQADPWALLLIIPAYWYVLYIKEELNGTDLTTESARSYSSYTDPGLLDDTNNYMDTTSTGSRTNSNDEGTQ